MKDHETSLVMTILAVIGATCPIVFGFVVYKLTQFFVTKETFQAFEDNANSQRGELIERVTRIDDKVSRLLELRVNESVALIEAIKHGKRQ